jgi:signal transduction histidine kinase
VALLALPRFRAQSALKRQWESLLLLSAAVLACTASGSWILVGRSLSPIHSLARQARAAAEGGAAGLQTRLSAPSPDRELVELVETFNALLQSLLEDSRARARFYMAASHELRTPLQALKGHLDLALSRERDAPAYRAALEESQVQARRLAGLVSELLRLNQIEMATSIPAAETMDLADLLESTLRPLRAELEERGVRVQTDWPVDAEIQAPRAHVEMIARNLIDNAAKYCCNAGEIRVQVRRDGGATQLDVFNECGPQQGACIDKWCEPFFRPDASRRSQTGGSGLGLALVKAVCDANGWRLTLRAEPGGVRVAVAFHNTVSDGNADANTGSADVDKERS